MTDSRPSAQAADPLGAGAGDAHAEIRSKATGMSPEGRGMDLLDIERMLRLRWRLYHARLAAPARNLRNSEHRRGHLRQLPSRVGERRVRHVRRAAARLSTRRRADPGRACGTRGGQSAEHQRAGAWGCAHASAGHGGDARQSAGAARQEPRGIRRDSSSGGDGRPVDAAPWRSAVQPSTICPSSYELRRA